jgi:hypothetical protein
VNAVDALKVLRYVAGLPGFQGEQCLVGTHAGGRPHADGNRRHRDPARDTHSHPSSDTCATPAHADANSTPGRHLAPSPSPHRPRKGPSA